MQSFGCQTGRLTGPIHTGRPDFFSLRASCPQGDLFALGGFLFPDFVVQWCSIKKKGDAEYGTGDPKGTEAKAHGMMRRDHPDQAAEELKKAIDRIEALEEYQDGETWEMHSFVEPFEDVLYHELFPVSKDVKNTYEPVSEVYLQYASALFELERYEEAEAAVKQAIRWAPTHAKNYFEYMELLKQKGDLEEFFQINLETFHFTYIPQDIARLYRNLGYYFLEKGRYNEALACITMSLNFDSENKQGKQLLYFIQETGGRDVKEPTFEALQQYGEKYGFPAGAAPEVVSLAYGYGQFYEEQGNREGQQYFYTILYNLTGDEEVKDKLDKLDNSPRIILS